MLRNVIIGLLMLGSVSISSMAFAHELEADMKTLAKSTKAFAATNDIETAKKQLAIMRQAALASKQSVPHKLETLSPEHEQAQANQAALD